MANIWLTRSLEDLCPPRATLCVTLEVPRRATAHIDQDTNRGMFARYGPPGAEPHRAKFIPSYIRRAANEPEIGHMEELPETVLEPGLLIRANDCAIPHSDSTGVLFFQMREHPLL